MQKALLVAVIKYVPWGTPAIENQPSVPVRRVIANPETALRIVTDTGDPIAAFVIALTAYPLTTVVT